MTYYCLSLCDYNLQTMMARSLPIYFTFIILFLAAYILFKDTPVGNPENVGRFFQKESDGETQEHCEISLLENATDFVNYFKNVEATCSNWTTFGTNSGMKLVCLDPKFNIKPGNCIVLSFGIAGDWSFDDAFDRFNCKVYSFDPTVDYEDHNRSKNIQFIKVGIGSIDGKQRVGMDNKWSDKTVQRYETLLERLGLLHSTIDYIKMDVEYSELDFFMDVFMRSPYLLKNIKQIGMEVHHGYEVKGLGHMSRFQMFWVAFQFLRCHGFKLYHARAAGPWHEVVWARDDSW